MTAVEPGNRSASASDGHHGHGGTATAAIPPERRRKPWNRTLEAEGSIPFSSTDFTDLRCCVNPPERFEAQSFRGGRTGEIYRAVRS